MVDVGRLSGEGAVSKSAFMTAQVSKGITRHPPALLTRTRRLVRNIAASSPEREETALGRLKEIVNCWNWCQDRLLGVTARSPLWIPVPWLIFFGPNIRAWNHGLQRGFNIIPAWHSESHSRLKCKMKNVTSHQIKSLEIARIQSYYLNWQWVFNIIITTRIISTQGVHLPSSTKTGLHKTPLQVQFDQMKYFSEENIYKIIINYHLCKKTSAGHELDSCIKDSCEPRNFLLELF
jgi:hypothetical protein